MNTFSDPRMIIEQLPIFSGQKVADFGSGSGSYTFLLSKKVSGSQEGAVYAIDVRQAMVEQIAAETRKQNMSNVHAVWGDLEQDHGSRLRDDSVQSVLVANTLFQLDDHKALIKEAHRVLSYEGLLVVIDWSESFGNIGPAPDHVVTQEAAKLLVEEQGFEIQKDIKAGEHHYGFIAIKKNK